MDNSKSSKQILLTTVGVAILVVALVGITFAFFNYTRTGTANTISTGQINFLTTQSNTLSLTNVFPMASSEVTNANLDEVEIRIQGDTTYSGGEEFEITIEGLTNTIGTSPNEKTIPINFVARYVPTASGDNIGSAAVSDYFVERGSTTTVYELTESGVATNGKQILVGYIPANGEIDGTLKVSAYIDSANIAISDTYNGPVATPNDNMGTTSEWVAGRTVLTTAEWNALQNSQTPLSFKIKAVSQEGTWVEENRTINVMNKFPEVINNKKNDIVEVYFNKMGATRMQNAYDNATIKADLTYNNEGKVLAWLETNPDDNTKYNLIVASDGDTYLTTGEALFAAWSGMEKIEFNNINTSRVTNMSTMFGGCSSLTSLDLSDFNTDNVTDMSYMFVACTSLTNVNLSSFNTINVNAMNNMFVNCSSLSSLDLSSFNTSNVDTMYVMFASCSNLATIYVSNTWSTSSVTISSAMFVNCTSLVGGNGTRYSDVYDEQDPSTSDKTMAVIDDATHEGYLTLKTN